MRGIRLKKIFAFLLVFAFALSFAACAEDKGYTVRVEGGSSEAAQAEVWTMPSTVKILRDVDYSQYYADPVLEYDSAKNEYVSAQIIMTAKNDVSSYDLELSDLVSEDGTYFSRANFDVYNQHYVKVSTRTNPNSGVPLGYYPDALIPMANAKRAGENKLVKNQNQGIWVTVYTPEDTPAGTYSGTFTLHIGGEEETIPVSLRVRGFSIPEEVHARTTFNLFPEYIAGAQLSNTRETYKRIVDYMLDYRISTTQIVRDDAPIEEWVEQIKEYAADPRVTSYNVITSQNISSRERIIALIEASEPGLNLLEKAYIYLRDEPYDALATAKKEHDEKIDELIAIAESYSQAELREHGLTRADIEGMEVLVTVTESIGKIEGLRTYCPLLSDLDTPAQRETYARYREEAYKGANNELAGTDYGTTWWYVCVHPSDPYTNYTIDIDLVGSRIASWMQYDYDIEGMLFWGIASYALTTSLYDEPVGWQNSDVYNDPNGVYRGANGDGYLIYPGEKYGIEDPIPTIRLMSIRDGLQDYEYLYMLEELAAEYADKYNISDYSFDDIMRTIYDRLYTGAKPTKDFELVLDAKSEVADMIELLSSDLHGMVEVGSIDAIGKKVPVTIYAESGTTLEYGGETLVGTPSGDGVKFELILDVESQGAALSATLRNGTSSYHLERFVTTDVKSVSVFDSAEEIGDWSPSVRTGVAAEEAEHVFVSLNTDADYTEQGTGSMKVEVEHRDYSTLEQLNYQPYVSMTAEKFLGEDSFTDLDSITFSVYNPGPAFNMKVVLLAESGSAQRTRDIYSGTVSSGWNVVKVTDIQKISWMYRGENMLEKVTEVRIAFPLDTQKDYTAYIDQMYYFYKGDAGRYASGGETKWLKDTSGETTETFTPVRSDPNLVTSFESYQEVVSDMKLLNFFGTARFVDGKGQYLSGEKDPDHPADRSVVTEGSYALKVEAQGDYRNTTEMPSITVKTKMGGGSFDKYDFTDVDKILLDVYNANDTEQKVYVQYLTDSVTGSKLTSAYAATVPANSFKTVEIEIDRSFVSQLLNLEQISQVRICFDPETEYGQPTRLFYIDNLRLHTTDEPIDTSVALRKDNELESADKADYLSLWKTIGNYTFFPSQLTFNTDPAFIKGGTGSFKLSNVPGYYGPESINPVVYTIGWELSPLQKDISDWNGITYWVYNSYDQPLQDWVRRTIRSAEGDDSQDGFYNMLQPGWNQRTLTKEDLLELGFVLDDFSIFTLMFSVPSQDACDLYIDEIMFY